jgi:hypothetical protein
MSIKHCPKDDWIQIDRGYLDRLAERKSTAQAYPEKAVGVNEYSAPAIKELWTEATEHILVKFPTIFQQRSGLFTNAVTGKTWDMDEVAKDGVAQLNMLSENVEEDFYFMCPDGENSFRLQGYIACFPGGFDSPSRVGQSMAEIHDPVPGYRERIRKGTDLFFARMKGGTRIQRFNVCVPSLSCYLIANISVCSGASKSMARTSSVLTATTSTRSEGTPSPTLLRR